MIWLGLEDAAIEAFSLPELALSMKEYRLLDGLR
jgi:hypothetical protein